MWMMKVHNIPVSIYTHQINVKINFHFKQINQAVYDLLYEFTINMFLQSPNFINIFQLTVKLRDNCISQYSVVSNYTTKTLIF